MDDKKALIVPIRTRGAVRHREDNGEVPSALPRRTRGAAHARGATPPSAPPRLLPNSAIPKLVDNLRKQSENFPLGAVVYGWGTIEAEDFVNTLKPFLWQEDALVLLPSGKKDPGAFPIPAGAVLLNMDRSSHKHMWDNGNLGADLVFFGEPGEYGAGDVRLWKDSARAVIVAAGHGQDFPVIRAARDLGLEVYAWSGEDDSGSTSATGAVTT